MRRSAIRYREQFLLLESSQVGSDLRADRLEGGSVRRGATHARFSVAVIL